MDESPDLPDHWGDVACWEWKWLDPNDVGNLWCAVCGCEITSIDSPAVRLWTTIGHEYRVHAQCFNVRLFHLCRVIPKKQNR